MGHGQPSDSDCDSEESGNERNLSENVALLQPPDLPLANHVHRLNTLNRPPRRVKRPEALTCSYAAFDRPMILLHHIVKIANGSTMAAPAEFLSSLIAFG
jgi:hypothetical protein